MFNVSMLFRLICPKFIFDQLLIGRSNRFCSFQSGCSKVFSTYDHMAESPEGWIFHVDKNNCASFEATRSHHKIALGLFPDKGNFD